MVVLVSRQSVETWLKAAALGFGLAFVAACATPGAPGGQLAGFDSEEELLAFLRDDRADDDASPEVAAE